MTRPFLSFCFGLLLLTGSCGGAGGTEAGNPPSLPTRAVTGDVSSGNVALVKNLAGCLADTVIATDAQARTTSVNVDSDCSFTLELEVDQAYALSLLDGDTFVAAFLFDNSIDRLDSPTFVVSRGTGPIALGRITLSNGRARCEFRPADQNDRDDDGISDFEDDDDDGDGIHDADEDDCDLDGYQDDHDDSCEETSGDARVIEARPHNGEDDVGSDEQIEVRFNCDIDPSTVNATTFVVSDGDSNVLDCDFEVEDDRVSCEHEDDFLEDATYTVTVSGVTCADDTPVVDATWSFTTRD